MPKPFTALISLLLLAGCPKQSSEILEQGAESARKINQAINRIGAQSSYRAKVSAISDGDTLRVVDGNGRKRKIRMAYIDAPEIPQAHGTASRDALAAILEGRTVDITVFERDRYKREVAQVLLNGRDINLAQLENGHAWHYISIAKKKQRKTDYAAYAYAEWQAKSRKKGLWSGTKPQAPWDFRQEMRSQQADTAMLPEHP